MIDGSILTSTLNIRFLLRQLFRTILNSERVASFEEDAVLTVRGTSPRWTLKVEKAEMAPGGLFKQPFSACQVACEGRKPLWWSYHLGFSLEQNGMVYVGF